jgi:hypothetical protein
MRPIALCLMLIGLALMALGLLGYAGRYSLHYVASGSMQPYVPPGSLILVDSSPLPAQGDMALVGYYGELIAHRAAGLSPDGSALILTADAMPGFIQAVPLSSVKGVVVLAIPYLGYLPMLFRPHVYLLGPALAALALLLAIRRWAR